MAVRPQRGAAYALLAAPTLAVALACSGSAPGAPGEPAGPVTYHRDVARILDANCVVCHREGESAPFPLDRYGEARKRARQIAVVTEARFMPPWLPAPNPDEFRGARRLSEEEIATLAAWAEAGAPEGDPRDRPPPPDFPDGWALGEPDLVVAMPEAYPLPAEGTDVFRNFVVPTAEPAVRHVRAFDLRPENPRVVHHAVLQVDTTSSSRRRDGSDGLPGFAGMEASSDAATPDGFFLGWTPGRTPLDAGGLAWTLEPGADLVLNLHLQPSGKPESVRASVALYFADEAPRRRPVQLRLGSETIDVPAGERDWRLRDRYELPVDVEILGLYPHAHHLAAEMRAWARTPDGGTRTLLHVPEWNFDWQDDYAYEEPIALPAGTVLEIDYRYDNSTGNPFQPSQPPVRVRYGPRSKDEMGDLWVQVLARDPEERELLARDFLANDARRKIAGHRFRLEHDPGSAEDHAALGYWLLVRGELADALDHLREAVRISPELATAHQNLGFALGRIGRPDEARRAFERAIELDPHAADAHNNLGLLLLEAGEVEAGERSFRAALERRPSFPEALNNLGRAREARGDLDGAMEAFRSAVRARPSYAKAHFNLGLVLRRAGRAGEARAALEEAVRHAPAFARARAELGLALWRERRPARAIEHLREAARLEPLPEHLDPLAWALATCPIEALRDAAEAVRLAERAVEAAPEGPARSRFERTLAVAYAADGRTARAVETAESALARLGKDDPLAPLLRAELARYRAAPPE